MSKNSAFRYGGTRVRDLQQGKGPYTLGCSKKTFFHLNANASQGVMFGRHTSSKIEKLGILSQHSINALYLHYTKSKSSQLSDGGEVNLNWEKFPFPISHFDGFPNKEVPIGDEGSGLVIAAVIWSIIYNLDLG